MERFRIVATYKGQLFEMFEEGRTGAEAVRAARRTARSQGMSRVLVRSVKSVVSMEDEAERPEYVHGPDLGVGAINEEIRNVLGEVPLRAIQVGGRMYLSDGENEPIRVTDLSCASVVGLLYDWAVFTGYTNEDFEDFISLIDAPVNPSGRQQEGTN